MNYKIIKDREFLHKKTDPVSSVEEGMDIACKLITTLDEIGVGIGLSANQIGIRKSVSIVRVKKDTRPWILINPVITATKPETITYLEGCLSLPGKQLAVRRHLGIEVTTLNHANILTFKPDIEPVTRESVMKDYGLLETICVQHEIDHLNGKLINDSDRRVDISAKVPVKYGRNDKVMIVKDGETQFIKYKSAESLLAQGWRIL